MELMASTEPDTVKAGAGSGDRLGVCSLWKFSLGCTGTWSMLCRFCVSRLVTPCSCMYVVTNLPNSENFLRSYNLDLPLANSF